MFCIDACHKCLVISTIIAHRFQLFGLGKSSILKNLPTHHLIAWKLFRRQNKLEHVSLSCCLSWLDSKLSWNPARDHQISDCSNWRSIQAPGVCYIFQSITISCDGLRKLVHMFWMHFPSIFGCHIGNGNWLTVFIQWFVNRTTIQYHQIHIQCALHQTSFEL